MRTRSSDKRSTKVTPSRTKTDTPKYVDVSAISSNSLKRTQLSSKSTPKHSNSKRRKITEEPVEIEHDPYELSGDENGSPIPFPTTSDTTIPSVKPVIARATEDKKRKFFITRTLEVSKRPNFCSLELVQRKSKTTTKRVSKLMPSRSRPQPLTDDERARIAATTIWLPIPNQQIFQANQENVPSLPSTSQTQSKQQPISSAIHQTLTTSLPPIEENDNFSECGGGLGGDKILTGNLSIQMSNPTPSLTSPSVSKAPVSGPCSTPVNKLTGKIDSLAIHSRHNPDLTSVVGYIPHLMCINPWSVLADEHPMAKSLPCLVDRLPLRPELLITSAVSVSLIGKPRIKTIGYGGGVQPLADVSNVLVSSVKRRTTAEIEIKDQQEARRISFAQPLSPIPKRNSSSRGSSEQSGSGLKISRRNRSQDEDQSIVGLLTRPLELMLWFSRPTSMPDTKFDVFTVLARITVHINYEEWLKEFNSHLKPYEDFNLTID
ncbi:hypothetical protein ACTXT7_011743 [Hymenolepis weldensis]